MASNIDAAINRAATNARSEFDLPHLLSPGTQSCENSVSSECGSVDDIDVERQNRSMIGHARPPATFIFEDVYETPVSPERAQTYRPKPKPSLTINTRDIWEEEEEEGKKSKTESHQIRTPSTVATTPSSPSDSVYTIEHKHIYKKSRQSKAIALSKPVVAIAGIVVVALTGGSAFLLSEWFTIPGLNAQIEELTAQVDRLTLQVDRMEQENKKFSDLNDRLEQENAAFAAQIVTFADTNALYEELNNDLSDLTDENKRLNDMLEESNAQYQELNVQLKETKDELNVQVDNLSVENSKLNRTVISYVEQNGILAHNINRLEEGNSNLMVQIETMNSSISDMTKENDRLSNLNDELGVIVSFLDETADSLQKSYDDIAKFLSDQITAGRSIWTITTQNIYRSRTNNMVCDLQSRFSGQPFVEDAKLPIAGDYQEVIGYVDEYFLSELCVQRRDFEIYLAESIGSERGMSISSNVSLSDLIKAMMRFNVFVMDYYFPKDATGLEMSDWSAAQYRCENLTSEKRFVWPR